MENRDDQNKNQTGQQGQQGQQFTDKRDQQGYGQQGQTSTGQTGSDQGAFGKTGADTTTAADQKSQFDKQRQDEAGSDKGFVGTSKEKDTSEAYLAEGDSGQADFAETGQGASENRAASATNEDIESGTPATRDATLDDGS